MRNETEVIQTVLNFAENNDMIRAALLNGSRTNPNVARDIFCDYDIGLYVTDPDHFWHDRSWIQQFGELIILQANEWEEGDASGYIFLMLFTDGVRIDLAFDPIEHFELFLDDSLTVVLLDKDQVMPTLPPSTECSYFSKKPSQKEFDETANEFLGNQKSFGLIVRRYLRCLMVYINRELSYPLNHMKEAKEPIVKQIFSYTWIWFYNFINSS